MDNVKDAIEILNNHTQSINGVVALSEAETRIVALGFKELVLETNSTGNMLTGYLLMLCHILYSNGGELRIKPELASVDLTNFVPETRIDSISGDFVISLKNRNECGTIN